MLRQADSAGCKFINSPASTRTPVVRSTNCVVSEQSGVIHFPTALFILINLSITCTDLKMKDNNKKSKKSPLLCDAAFHSTGIVGFPSFRAGCLDRLGLGLGEADSDSWQCIMGVRAVLHLASSSAIVSLIKQCCATSNYEFLHSGPQSYFEALPLHCHGSANDR